MESLWIVLTAILAGVATYYIVVFLNKGVVFGSAVVTLTSGVFLPHFIPELGSTLAVVATCASYAGMVAVKNVPNLIEMGIVGFIVGILFLLTFPAYVGIGGKLGTIAAIGCFVWIGIKKAYRDIKEEKSRQEIQRKLTNYLNKN